MTGFSDGADPRGKCRCLENTRVEFTEVEFTLTQWEPREWSYCHTHTFPNHSVTVSGFRTFKVHSVH